MALLEIDDVHKRFGNLDALQGVTFSVTEGEIFGVAGPNGAGKSVLFKTIAGVHRPDRGDIRLDGDSLVGLSPTKVCHRGLTRTFQTPTTFPSLTVRDNLRVGTTFGEGGRSVDELLDFLDLGRVADRKATNLDLFTLKRVVLGAALGAGARVLLLDEPMAGFSVVEIEKYRELVHAINDTWGVTIIIIEHLLDVLIGVSDRLMVLHYGQVLFSGLPEEVRSDETVAEVYLGQAPGAQGA
ncbi:MAG TPA: ATP-binding cassette domain-containing protein [Egibacteraceae bacterium]|nr:ATP-binding cassette domain-containing protein [Egibacteraceae bacterium]